MKTKVGYEVGTYETALSRAQLDIIRTGRGNGPNIMTAVVAEGIEIVTSLVQFPVIGRTTISCDVMVVVLMVEAPRGTRWCEIDVAPGDVLLYGPGADHTGVNPAGVECRFALIDLWMLDHMAEALRVRIVHPPRGSVVRCNPTAPVGALASALISMGGHPSPAAEFSDVTSGLVRAAVHVLADPSQPMLQRQLSRIENRHVVNQCVAYVDALVGPPSISELCIAAHVSERRLRTAFYETFDMPPGRFFRARLLSHARDRLLIGDQPVTTVALDLGFDHLGRFAGQYKQAYGEYPSDTLMAARSAGRPAICRPIGQPADASLLSA